MGTSANFLAANPSRDLSAVRPTDKVRVLGADGLDYWVDGGVIGATKLNRPIHVASFGDSTSSIIAIAGTPGFVNKTTKIQKYPSAVMSAGSGQINSDWNASLFGVGNIVYVGDGSHSGFTTAQLLNVVQSAYSATRGAIIDIINTQPDIIDFSGASVNDINYPAPEDGEVPELVISTCVSNHLKIVGQFIDWGFFVVSTGILGYANPTYASAIPARQRAATEINRRISSSLGTNRNCVFLDPNGVTSTDGVFLPNMSTDGLHLTPYGQRVIGKKKLELINSFFVGQSVYPIIVNSMQYNFANAVSGVPTKSLVETSGSVVLNGKTSDSSGIVIDFTVTGASHSVGFQQWAEVLFSGLSAGSNVCVSCGVRLVDKASGIDVPHVQEMFIGLNDGSGNALEYRRTIYSDSYSKHLLNITIPIASSSLHQSWSRLQFLLDSRLANGSYLLYVEPAIVSQIP